MRFIIFLIYCIILSIQNFGMLSDNIFPMTDWDYFSKEFLYAIICFKMISTTTIWLNVDCICIVNSLVAPISYTIKIDGNRICFSHFKIGIIVKSEKCSPGILSYPFLDSWLTVNFSLLKRVLMKGCAAKA